MWEGKGWLLALLIAAAGIWLRLEPLTAYWVNGDEGLSDFLAHAPLALARGPIAPSAHPPLYFWLLRGVAAVFEGFVWLRVPALLCGAAGILAMYWLGRELAGEVAGVAAALLMAFSPAAIELSAVIRPYAFQNLMLTAALLFAFRFLRTRSRGDLGGYVASMLVALLLHYGTFVVLAAVVCSCVAAAVARQLDTRELRDLCLAQLPLVLVAVALYSLHIGPDLMDASIRRQAVVGWLAPQFVTSVGDGWRAAVGVFDFLLGARASIAGILAFVVGFVICMRERRYALAALGVGALAVAVVLSGLALHPFGATRHSFYFAPIVFATIGCGAAWVVARGRAATAAALGAVAALVVAAAPAAVLLGLPVARPLPLPEVRVPRLEVESLGGVFAELAATPGVAFVDLETVYMLSPLLRAADAWPSRLGSPAVAVYPWRERRVVAAPVRQRGGAGEERGSSRHLSGLLRNAGRNSELAELVDRDSVVITTDAGRTLASIRRMASTPEQVPGFVDEIAVTDHFEIFRFDAKRYREALNERRRALRQERGRRPLGFE
jgi:4-amino-4-deoxy-L-arabinose transferase-like glycosyltransferase